MQQLWQHAFLDPTPPESLLSERWKEIGFQGTNPGTDFRGAGLLGLQQLLYFVMHYPEDFRKVRTAAFDYPFAISALNITYFLIFYLQINERKDVAQPDQRLAPAKYPPQRMLKSFFRLQSQHPEALDELYCAALLFMHHSWLRLNKTQRLSIMEFRQAIRSAEAMVERVLGTQPRSLGELLHMKEETIRASEE